VTIDDRLRAAGRALKDSSLAQVDAASRLREIVGRTGQPVAHGPTAALPDRPPEPPEPLAPPLPPAPPRRTPQRLALAVNLLLVLALGIVIGVAATDARDANGGAPANASVSPTSARTAAATTIVAARTVPEPCLDAAELADEVISRMTRNERDNRLAEILRDYTIASQACRREASP
jgi:hypothetical protein